ncbi:hypothetical protein E2605_03065 [Dysgonomonas capnocytophagoides]|uniref:Apea-like HEPN domain-containing protein n=1 Tax=Dysgonomonas capnocytophagoides TaxID=45254 RepID=A0A4Y8LEY8_9BACT|nr:hypothetical protein [Dysgonomonas capnocytophagoides]TFD99076.1 hypothetical protein E2605_03065 [Dysgonomonas capnocytophagoides]
MIGQELISKIIISLDQYLGINDIDTQDLINIDNNLEGAISRIKRILPSPIFIPFVNSLETIVLNNVDNFLNTPYTIPNNVYTIDFNQQIYEQKNRRFGYSDVNFGFVSSKIFFDCGNLIDFADPKYSIIWKQIEEYYAKCFLDGDNTSINILFDVIKHIDINKGFMLNKSPYPNNEMRQYSYIYLAYLNNSQSIFLSNDLKYNTTYLNSTFAYNDFKNYEQYFDIYDVINELNQAPDILNRFLRLYHALEYMVYRVYLVDLVSRIGSSKLFVREFISSAETMKKSEKESFVKNFKIIFDTDLSLIRSRLSGLITPSIRTFLEQKNIVKGFGIDIKKIAELIYGIRCCIVHNKESEYHITTSNSEDYSTIIPLIRKLLEIFEDLIIAKISANNNKINYPQSSINLY